MERRRSRLRRVAFVCEVAAIGAMTVAGLVSALSPADREHLATTLRALLLATPQQTVNRR